MIVVGGGISGLMAALAAHERGEKDITIYEASDRFGGKMLSAQLDGKVVNMGPEFIDEENTRMRALADQLGVRLVPTGEQSKEVFQSPAGNMMPDFIEQYAPIARRIMQIRDEMEKNPVLAERMKSTSAKELMEELRNEVPAIENPTLMQRLYQMVTFSDNRVPQEVVDTALAAMNKELGETSNHITAAQFMSETSPSPDRFLTSTCDYRVEGGTLTLATELKKHLEQVGVKFETGHALTEIHDEGHHKKNLTFATAKGEQKIHSDKVIIALPAYSLPKVKGLEFLGLESSPVQYTKNAKITVKVKPGVKLPTDEANAFLAGAECWSPDPGLVTFLVHNEQNKSPAVVIRESLENYAQAFGMKVDDVFYMEKGKPQAGTFVYTNPGNAPCWSTPSPENAHQNEQLFTKMEKMADQGLGFVGTYIPLPDGGVGFMECGAESVDRVVTHMYGKERGHHHEVTVEPEKQRPSFAERIRAEDRGASLAV